MCHCRLTEEGELIPMCSKPLKLEAETMMPDDNFIFLAWPVTAVHRINEESPLWDVGAEQLLQVRAHWAGGRHGTNVRPHVSPKMLVIF